MLEEKKADRWICFGLLSDLLSKRHSILYFGAGGYDRFAISSTIVIMFLMLSNLCVVQSLNHV